MKKRVVVADGNIAVQKLIEYTLSKEGFEVNSVNDGISALDLSLSFKPDILVATYNLEGMSIYDFCNKTKKYPDLKEVAILVLVSYSDKYDEDKLKSEGVRYCIKKPINTVDLIEKVKLSLSHRPIEEMAVLTKEEVVAQKESIDLAEAPLEAKNKIIDQTAKSEEKEEMVNIEDLLGWSFSEQPQEKVNKDLTTAKTEPEIEKEEVEIKDELELIDEGESTQAQIIEEPRIEDETFEEISTEAMFEESVIEEKAEEKIEEKIEELEELIEEPLSKEEIIATPDKEPLISSYSSEIREIPPELIEKIVEKMAKEIIEKIAWEVVPDLAEIEIKKEIKRLTTDQNN